MSTRITKRVLSVFLAVCMLFSSFTMTAFASTVTWTPSENTKIYVDSTSVGHFQDMKYEANLFSEEYAEKLDRRLNVTIGSVSDADSGDIILMYDGDVSHEQGFRVTVYRSQLIIAASGDDGLFYGWQYVIKQMLANGCVAATTEAPDVNERAVSLDNGRKYYTVDAIKTLIREMAWAGMNTLVMRFSGEMGLGLESKLYPWLNGRDGTLCTRGEVATDNRYLTREDFAEIAAYAAAYHVELVPSLDSPDHLSYLVKKVNERAKDQDFSFTYRDQTYTVEAGTEIGRVSLDASDFCGIDISNEAAVAFVMSLMEEYATLFKTAGDGSSKIDIGGDALSEDSFSVPENVGRWEKMDHWRAYAQAKTGNEAAVAYDAYILYMNKLNALARDLGYSSVRMWNDNALRTHDTTWTGVARLDTNIDIWFRSTGVNSISEYTGAGYQVYNILSDYACYALTEDYFSEDRESFTRAYPELIYTEWSPYLFDPDNTVLGTGSNLAIGNMNVLGGAFSIRCDDPTLRTEEQVLADVLPMIRAIGAKSWDATANSRMKYADFTAYWDKLGEAVSLDPAAISHVIPDPALLRAAIEDASTVDGLDYGEISYGAYMDAVNAGREVLSRGASSQAELNLAVMAIRTAKDALTTDKSTLKAAVDESASITNDMYTVDSYAGYVQSIAAGRIVLNDQNATQKDIVAAYQAIQDAKAALTADKTALRNELNGTPSLDTVDTSRLTEFIMTTYNTALANAEAVLADTAATQQEVDEALEDFRYAKGYIFVDYSALEAEVAKADKVEENKELYAIFYYEDYMFAIQEAKTYYLGENAYPFHQTHVDAMTNMLRAGHYNLVTYCTVAKMTKDLVARIERYYKEDLVAFKAGRYTIESWMFYSSLIKGAETMLLGSYNYEQVEDRVELIDLYRLMLRTEDDDIRSGRHDIINSASFQTSTSYAGALVRISLDTIRSFDMTALIILDENGFLVESKNMTHAPLNRRKPKSKITYVDLVLDVEPGTHTYTIYVSDRTATHPYVVFCKDPIQCTITVQ